MNGSQYFSLTPLYNGRFSDGVAILKPFLVKNPPTAVDLVESDYLSFLLRNNDASDVRVAYIKSGIVPQGGLTSDMAEIMLNYFRVAPKDSIILWTQEGGAVDEKSRTETAFPHRGVNGGWL